MSLLTSNREEDYGGETKLNKYSFKYFPNTRTLMASQTMELVYSVIAATAKLCLPMHLLAMVIIPAPVTFLEDILICQECLGK